MRGEKGFVRIGILQVRNILMYGEQREKSTNIWKLLYISKFWKFLYFTKTAMRNLFFETICSAMLQIKVKAYYRFKVVINKYIYNNNSEKYVEEL